MPELLNLPPEILLAIIDFVGFPGMFDLRQVCRNFRNLIDDRKPNPRLKYASFFLLRGEIMFHCKHNSKYYLIKYPKSSQEQFFKDLVTILISQRATVIKRLYTSNGFRRIPRFYTKFKKLLESRPFLLKIEQLWMDAKNENQLYSVLSKLDPKALKEIKILCPRGGIPNFVRIVELEQWKSAKKLRIFDAVMDIPFSILAHFSYINVHLKTVKFKELDEFKKALLTCQDPESFCSLRYTEMIGEEQWRQSLGPNYGEDERKWFFQFEKSTKGLHIYSGNTYILFEITDTKMPELLGLPPEILLAIIDFVGFPGMFNLRQVCRNFRNLIDDRKPNPRLKDVSIVLWRGDIRFLCLHNSKRYLIQYPKSNQEQFFNDLETILISQRATVIGRFYTHNGFRRIPKFYTKFKKHLESRPFLLKIEKLSIDIKNHNQLYSVLSKLDPNALKDIHIFCPRGGIPNFGRVVELEQWKRAKELNIFNCVMDIPFSILAHFSVLYVHLKTVKYEELEEFKKALLTSQDPDSYCHLHFNAMIGAEQWRQSLGPNYGDKKNKWFFQFEKSTKGLYIYWRNQFIEIRIIDVNSLQSE